MIVVEGGGMVTGGVVVVVVGGGGGGGWIVGRRASTIARRASQNAPGTTPQTEFTRLRSAAAIGSSAGEGDGVTTSDAGLGAVLDDLEVACRLTGIWAGREGSVEVVTHMDRPANVEIGLEVAAGAGRHSLDPGLTLPVGELAGRVQVCHTRVGPRAALLNGYPAIRDPPGALDEDDLTILEAGSWGDRHLSRGGLRRSRLMQADGHQGNDQDIHPARAFQRSAFLGEENGSGRKEHGFSGARLRSQPGCDEGAQSGGSPIRACGAHVVLSDKCESDRGGRR